MADTAQPALDNDRAVAHTGTDTGAGTSAHTATRSNATATAARRLHNTHRR
jgi:hypothetical protein